MQFIFQHAFLEIKLKLTQVYKIQMFSKESIIIYIYNNFKTFYIKVSLLKTKNYKPLLSSKIRIVHNIILMKLISKNKYNVGRIKCKPKKRFTFTY